MNTQRINSNELKILLTLQHISDDTQQWKENEKTDLGDATITDKQPDDWTGFKTRFLKNWEEIDSSGNVYLVIEGPVWSGFFPNMGKP